MVYFAPRASHFTIVLPATLAVGDDTTCFKNTDNNYKHKTKIHNTTILKSFTGNKQAKPPRKRNRPEVPAKSKQT